MAGIYIHIPFCKQACYYCDFHFSTNQSQKPELVAAIKQEILLQKSYLNDELVETIYFGGGTPSLLTEVEVQSIIERLNSTFCVDTNVEITLEANPDDLSMDKLKELSNAGINRLSIGIQSFDDKILKLLNRAHSGDEAYHCLENARSAGFKNLSIDLIYGIPGRSNEEWLNDLNTALSFKPEHISAYSLTVEPGTVFSRWQRNGRFPKTDDEQSAVQFEMLINVLHKAGFEHYEISNFCKPNMYSRHNSSYWKQKKYLGLGPSAHSFNGNTRQFNIKKNGIYIKKVMSGSIPSTVEELSESDKVNEYLLTTLRTKWGADLDFLQKKHGIQLKLEKNRYVSDVVNKGYAFIKNDFLILTDRGKFFADKIASDLFIE